MTVKIIAYMKLDTKAELSIQEQLRDVMLEAYHMLEDMHDAYLIDVHVEGIEGVAT